MTNETTTEAKRTRKTRLGWLALLLLVPVLTCGPRRCSQPPDSRSDVAAPGAVPKLAPEVLVKGRALEPAPASEPARPCEPDVSTAVVAPNLRPAARQTIEDAPATHLGQVQPVSLGPIADPPPMPITFEGTTLEGKALSLEALRGRVVIIDIISGHCGFCFAETPELKRLVAKYDDVTLVAIAPGETDDDLRPSIEQQNEAFPFPVVADPKSLILESLPNYGTPTHVVLDREGRVTRAGIIAGSKRVAELERAVRVARGRGKRR